MGRIEHSLKSLIANEKFELEFRMQCI